MKKYIRSESFRRRELPNYQRWYKAVRQDIRRVGACQNEEDLANLELASSNGDFQKDVWNERFENMGVTDFDEKIDLIIDWLCDTADYIKETSNRYSTGIETADRVLKDMEEYLTSRNFSHEVTSDGIKVYPENGTRDDLIQFIDDLIASLGGKYHGTGRGGSWSAWNVLIDGIEFQIGPPSRESDCWLIREV